MLDFLWRLAAAFGVAILLDWLWRRHRNGSGGAAPRLQSAEAGAGESDCSVPAEAGPDTDGQTPSPSPEGSPDAKVPFDWKQCAKKGWDGFVAWLRRVDWKRVAIITGIVLGVLWKAFVWLLKNSSKLAGNYSGDNIMTKNIQE